MVEVCSDGDVLIVRKFLYEGGSVYEIIEEGESLLFLVCLVGYYEFV